MKRKTKIISVIILIILICMVAYLIYNNYTKKNNKKEEYIPEEEISEEQMRQTVICLYYKNKDTGELMPESRKIDANLLTVNPYKTVVEMLIDGPKSDKLEKIIPDGTKINDIRIEAGIVYIDFSKEFIENCKGEKDEQKKVIYSIINSLSEFSEVDGIKILIEGEKNKTFNKEIDFSNIFTPNI